MFGSMVSRSSSLSSRASEFRVIPKPNHFGADRKVSGLAELSCDACVAQAPTCDSSLRLRV